MPWDKVEKYLIESRYAVTDPETGLPTEHTYDEILNNRIIPALEKTFKTYPGGQFFSENLYSDIVHFLSNRTIILATPALMSLGNPHTRRYGYFSCYPLGPVEDSLDGIEEMHHKMRKIYTAGGGVGIDVSRLRAKNSRVDNGQGLASGPVGFLADFDAVTGTTNQGGRRRGALLVQMDWNHPDIKEFIQAKNFNHTLNRLIQTLPADQRPNRGLSLSNMNISVNVFGDFWKDEALINLIAENMWKTGDPGLLFVDNMLKYSPFASSLEPKYSNPCVPGDTFLTTKNGGYAIGFLSESSLPVTIWNGYEWTSVKPYKTADNQPLMKITFDHGFKLTCTPYHKFQILFENETYEVEARELMVGDPLKPYFRPDDSREIKLTVQNIEMLEECKDVYCFNEPLRHTGVFDGVCTFNCGEFLAPANSACNLITVNVAKLAADIYAQKGTKEDFFARVLKIAQIACHLGNIILTMDEGYPLEEIREKTQALRPVGVGMSGLHTALLTFTDAVYGDAEAVKFAEQVQANLTLGTIQVSTLFAKLLKSPLESSVINTEFWKRHVAELDNVLWGKTDANNNTIPIMYNSITTSQAPTGSTSIFLKNLDTGIEPFYSLEVNRRIEDREEGWKTYTLTPFYLKELFNKEPHKKELAESQTALKISAEGQLNMLGAFQKFCHTGCAKTINLPKTATVDDIKCLILKAKDMRLKGFTVYRDGSLDNVISINTPTAEQSSVVETPKVSDLKEWRPGYVYTAKSHSLNAHITLTHDEQKRIREVFVAAGGPGADINGIFTAFGMILSVSLRKAPELFEPLVKVLCKIRMDQRVLIKTNLSEQPVVGTSLPQAIGLLMKQHQDFLLAGETSTEPKKISGSYDLCPECQQLSLKREGSCMKCLNCGYSSC